MSKPEQKQQIIDILIEQIKDDINLGDCTVLDELLQRIPVDTLIHSLPEETWKFYEFENNYFNVKETGFNEDSNREEIQINCGENGVLYLFKTDEGFIVDVYNQSDNVNTMAVFETDLEPDEEDTIEDMLQDRFDSLVDQELAELNYNEAADEELLDDES